MNPLEVLKLKPGSSLLDAKKNYRQLSIKYHPDKNPGDSSAEESFRNVVDSYNLIVENPSLLTIKNTFLKARGYSGYILLSISANISDVYLGTLKNIQVSRKRICNACSGSGSSMGATGVCSLCAGNKRVRNRVSSLIGLGDLCPACSGTGTKDAPICNSCNGMGYINENNNFNFTISKDQFTNGLVVVRQEGDEFRRGLFGDVHIKLRVETHNRVTLEGDLYKLLYGITPAQFALGDRVKIRLFGKNLELVIPKGQSEAFISDKRIDGITRYVKVDLVVINKTHTPMIEDLYKEILRLEKSSLELLNP